VTSEFDVICLGAGPAGEALTSRLKGSGISLAVVENNLVGGECAYWGCMPSKTLLRSAEVIAEAGRARELAASRVDWEVDFGKVARRVAWMTRDLNDAIAATSLEKNGAQLFRGTGHLVDRRTVTVDGSTLRAGRAVVIATGTAPAAPRITGLDSVKYWTNREAVQAKELPRSLAIIGGGAVGVELAQAFARLGCQVHIVEGADRIVALEEPEAGNYLAQRFKAEGIAITTSARISKIESAPAGVRVVLESGPPIEAEKLLVATGRKPNSETFDLGAAGVRATDRGFIQVDHETLRAADGIFAIGDINGIGGFTHLSDYHGNLLGRAFKGEQVRADHTAVPRVTFTDPEVASVGLTAKQAADKGLAVATVSAEVERTGRGYIHGEPGGLIKLIADVEAGVLIGASVTSPRAGEMLSELSLAVKARTPIRLMADLIHPFPTFSRVLQYMFDELLSKVSTQASGVRA
jgi:pyruvate/2-oxoglutarate dehydrogenase complex dihydrolipoamide dehydrogenase (E3) component